MHYHTTVHGLEKWHQRMFEKLGWMVLAKRDKRKHKLMAYKEGVAHLHKAITERLAIIQDPDNKYDLEQLLFNVHSLQQTIQTLRL